MKKTLLKIFIFSVAIMLAAVNAVLLLDRDTLTATQQYAALLTSKLKYDAFDFRFWLRGYPPFNQSDSDAASINARLRSAGPPPNDSILAESTGQVSKPGIVGNQWLSVQTTPTSHFSLDVNDSNYEIISDAILEEDVVPPRSIIRIESLINHFDFYHKQSNDNRFLINYEIAPSPLESDTYLLMLKIKTRPFDPRYDQKDWNLFFAIDNSAEMQNNLLKGEMMQTLRDIVLGMSSKDRVGLLSFNEDEEIISGSTVGNSKSRLVRVLNGIEFKGNFGGVSGVLKRARGIVARHHRGKSLNKVVVITNGDFMPSDSELKQLKEKQTEHVFIYVVSLKDNKPLRDFYNSLGKEYHIKYAELDTFDDFYSLLNEKFFGDDADISAKEVMSKINFYPEGVNYYRLIGFSNFDIGVPGTLAGYPVPVDLKYNTSGTILYKLKFNSATLRENQPIGTLEISYKEVDTTEDIFINRPLYYKDKEKDKDGKKVSDDFNFAAAVAYTGEYLSNLSANFDYGIPEIRKLAEENKGKDASGKRGRFIELLEKIEGL